MRDDIHNRAPISAGLRQLLKQALRPADQLQPDRLRDRAFAPLKKEISRQLSGPLSKILRDEINNPSLFGKLSLPHACSRVEADIADSFALDASTSFQTACIAAVRNHIECLRRESEASMLAAGAHRSEIQAGLGAFKAALLGQTDSVVQVWVSGAISEIVKHRVSLSEPLSLGPAVRSLSHE